MKKLRWKNVGYNSFEAYPIKHIRVSLYGSGGAGYCLWAFLRPRLGTAEVQLLSKVLTAKSPLAAKRFARKILAEEFHKMAWLAWEARNAIS